MVYLLLVLCQPEPTYLKIGTFWAVGPFNTCCIDPHTPQRVYLLTTVCCPASMHASTPYGGLKSDSSVQPLLHLKCLGQTELFFCRSGPPSQKINFGQTQKNRMNVSLILRLKLQALFVNQSNMSLCRHNSSILYIFWHATQVTCLKILACLTWHNYHWCRPWFWLLLVIHFSNFGCSNQCVLWL